jgi:pimeloyl-ACP methyl ester carboxylesterase
MTIRSNADQDHVNPSPPPTSGRGTPNGDASRRAGAALEKPPAAPAVVFGYSTGMPGIFKSNFDYQLARAMPAGAYGEGGAVGEALSTARRIVDGDLESWVVAWTETAERVEKIGHVCLSGGHAISARDAFLRAAIYWKTGFFYLETKDPRQVAMYKRHRSCFLQAAKLFDPAIEPVSIPYEHGKTLPGYFMRAAAGGGRRPTVMILGGGDTTCEELYYWGGGAAAVRRGYNAFLWEGPGQVGTYALDRDLIYRPDWEVPTRYAVDYVLSRDDVDPKRLALSGHSMGGYFAPRAAAFEKRITAVIANSLLPDLKPMFEALFAKPKTPAGEELDGKVDLRKPLTVFGGVFRERCGMAGKSVEAFFEDMGRYRLAGLEGQITCPILVITGEGEGSLVAAAEHSFYEKLTCPKTQRMVSALDGGEVHCTLNNPSLKHQIEFDWLDDVFKKNGAS